MLRISLEIYNDSQQLGQGDMAEMTSARFSFMDLQEAMPKKYRSTWIGTKLAFAIYTI